jgi:hypothetical protein
MQKNIEASLVASKKDDLEVNAEKYKRGKAIPLQAWTGPEDSRRLRLPDFKTIGT